MNVRYLPGGLRGAGLLIYMEEQQTLYVDPAEGVEAIVVAAVAMLQAAGHPQPANKVRRIVSAYFAIRPHGRNTPWPFDPHGGLKLVRQVERTMAGPESNPDGSGHDRSPRPEAGA